MLYYQKFHQAWTLTWAMRRWQVAVWYHFDAGWLTEAPLPLYEMKAMKVSDVTSILTRSIQKKLAEGFYRIYL